MAAVTETLRLVLAMGALMLTAMMASHSEDSLAIDWENQVTQSVKASKLKSTQPANRSHKLPEIHFRIGQNKK